jgi:hypothetical protein
MRLYLFFPFLFFACLSQRTADEPVVLTADEMQSQIVQNLDSILLNADISELHAWHGCALKTMIERYPAEINFSHSAIKDTVDIASYFFNDVDMDFGVLKDRNGTFHFFHLPRLREVMRSTSMYKDESTNGYKELKDDKELSLISLNEDALDSYILQRFSVNGKADPVRPLRL